MRTIIIAIAIVFVFVLIIAWLTDSPFIRTIATGICFVVVLIGCTIGVIVPISGFNEWKLTQETELVTLSNSLASGGVGIIYVSLSADNAYTYRYEIDSEFGTETGKTYKTQTLVGKDVEEVEDPNCEKAVVRVYQREGKRTIWTFALGTEETKYIFYVPEGTISKEVKLK